MIKINQAIKISHDFLINPRNNHIDPGPTQDSAGCIGLASYRLCQLQKYLVLSQNPKFTREIPNFPIKIWFEIENKNTAVTQWGFFKRNIAESPRKLFILTIKRYIFRIKE